jgi:hypothetical protein
MTTFSRDKMSMDEYQHLRRMQKRYHRQADRPAKTALLDEMVAYTEMYRTSISRRLNGSGEHQLH